MKKEEPTLPLIAKLAIPLSCMLLMFIFGYVYMDREQFIFASLTVLSGLIICAFIFIFAVFISPIWEEESRQGKIYDIKTDYYYHKDELYNPTPMGWEKCNKITDPNPERSVATDAKSEKEYPATKN